jgi:hypothetical protein
MLLKWVITKGRNPEHQDSRTMRLYCTYYTGTMELLLFTCWEVLEPHIHNIIKNTVIIYNVHLIL